MEKVQHMNGNERAETAGDTVGGGEVAGGCVARWAASRYSQRLRHLFSFRGTKHLPVCKQPGPFKLMLGCLLGCRVLYLIR